MPDTLTADAIDHADLDDRQQDSTRAGRDRPSAEERRQRDATTSRPKRKRQRLVPRSECEPVAPRFPDEEKVVRFRELAGKEALSPRQVGELLALCRPVAHHLADERVVRYSEKLARHGQHGTPWTDAEREAVATFVERGLDRPTISQLLGRSEGAIRSAARRLVEEGRLTGSEADWLG